MMLWRVVLACALCATVGWGGAATGGDQTPLAVKFELPRVLAVPQSLPFALNASATKNAKTGDVLDADSRSMKLNGKQFYPIAGEIHPGRVPSSQWREQLMRMRAGGLNVISVYAFWIYHEEVRGKFVFEGRRDIGQFIDSLATLASKCSFAWTVDHGECRNGGHPDWVLDQCGRLRSTDSAYLAREALLQGAGRTSQGPWKDGGPIFAVQLDNETPDWKYLLALKDIAADSFFPVYFAKTGWPAPAGAPSNLPLMPYFGGYPDRFWSNDMHPDPSSGSYSFELFHGRNHTISWRGN